ncbi:MAG TPA: hypothetical protein VFE47_23500 [Tepidisphaeraceae bacterium]|jgi:hypothetical protein|nr:hypothetical protein [Tepidisphaeraceae bacterium]
MGVVVAAISKARRARKHKRGGDWCFEHHTPVFNWALPVLLDGRPEGCYCSKEGDLDCFDFDAGSYGGYNEFRDELSRLAIGIPANELWTNPEPHLESPFVELLLLRPEGNAIGPVTSAKLYRDFTRYAAAARKQWRRKSERWLLENYMDFRTAFRIAKNRGFVLLR